MVSTSTEVQGSKPSDSTKGRKSRSHSTDNPNSWVEEPTLFCGLSPTNTISPPELLPPMTDSEFAWDPFQEFIHAGAEYTEQGVNTMTNTSTSYSEDPQLPISRTTGDFENSSATLPDDSAYNYTWDSDLGLDLSALLPGDTTNTNEQQTPRDDSCASQSVSSTAYAKCNCLTIITQLLEADISIKNDGIDHLLKYMGEGTKTCLRVIACTDCNTCTDNAMLIAINSQQLVSAADQVSSRLRPTHRSSHTSDEKSRKICAVVETASDGIMFGKYKIELPEMKVQLFYKMVLLHFEGLQGLLRNTKERVGFKEGAWTLLVDAENNVAKLCWMVQELSK